MGLDREPLRSDGHDGIGHGPRVPGGLRHGLAHLPTQLGHAREVDAGALARDREVHEPAGTRVDVGVGTEQEHGGRPGQGLGDRRVREADPVGREAQVLVAEGRRMAAVVVDDGEGLARGGIDAQDADRLVERAVCAAAVAPDPGRGAGHAQGGRRRVGDGPGPRIDGRVPERGHVARLRPARQELHQPGVRARVGVDAGDRDRLGRERRALGEPRAQRVGLSRAHQADVEGHEQEPAATLEVERARVERIVHVGADAVARAVAHERRARGRGQDRCSGASAEPGHVFPLGRGVYRRRGFD